VSDVDAPRSPFHREQGRSPATPASGLGADGGIRIRDEGTLSTLRIRTWEPRTELAGVTLGRAAKYSLGDIVVSLAPREWIVLGTGRVDDLRERWSMVVPLAAGVIVDLSHGRATLRIAGSVPAILAHVCPIDLRRIAPGSAVRTSIAHVPTDIVFEDSAPTSWLLQVDRSYATYFLEVLIDAAGDAGVRLEVPPRP
jgi:heterotetrameric sarcosine oxidase gamma subunit